MIIIMMVGYMYHILRYHCYFYGQFMIHHMTGYVMLCDKGLFALN